MPPGLRPEPVTRMPPVRIDDPDDPRLAPYRDIRERDLVRRDGLFIAEGTTVLAVLVRQARYRIESLLLLENRVAGLEPLLRSLDPAVPVYEASQAVIDTVAGFHLHRGVLALAHRPHGADGAPGPEAADWKTVVALAGLANHDNVGAIFRNAAALGADAVLMDAATCDPLYRKAVRVSVGGVLTVPWHRFETASAMLGWLAGAGFSVHALSPSAGKALEDWVPEARTAILLGSEGPGLPAPILAGLPGLGIAMAGGFDSLNVATTGAIVLHHVRTSRNRPGGS